MSDKTTPTKPCELSAPEHIWLHICDEDDCTENFREHEGVTWSEDNADGKGVKYVRGDVVERLEAELAEARNRIFNSKDVAAFETLTAMLAEAKAKLATQFTPGPVLFSFSSYSRWVNHAHHMWKSHGVRAIDTLCIDQKGRVCAYGAHFMKARDEDAFPINVHLAREDSTKP